MRRFELSNVVNGMRGVGQGLTAMFGAIESALANALQGLCLKLQRAGAPTYWQGGPQVLPVVVDVPRRVRTSPGTIRAARPHLAPLR